MSRRARRSMVAGRRRKRPPRSLAKFFRREKARLRRMHSNFADAEEKIHVLVQQRWPAQQDRP